VAQPAQILVAVGGDHCAVGDGADDMDAFAGAQELTVCLDFLATHGIDLSLTVKTAPSEVQNLFNLPRVNRPLVHSVLCMTGEVNLIPLDLSSHGRASAFEFPFEKRHGIGLSNFKKNMAVVLKDFDEGE
jgi:hypothetical protein